MTSTVSPFISSGDNVLEVFKTTTRRNTLIELLLFPAYVDTAVEFVLEVSKL